MSFSRKRFSPRMWRCFLSTDINSYPDDVFSTHVEMFPYIHQISRGIQGFLHACGDVSESLPHLWRMKWFSPRMWRCFHQAKQSKQSHEVFSTHVEMFLQVIQCHLPTDSFLHACGDVSKHLSDYLEIKRFSPRMWRCFR